MCLPLVPVLACLAWEGLGPAQVLMAEFSVLSATTENKGVMWTLKEWELNQGKDESRKDEQIPYSKLCIILIISNIFINQNNEAHGKKEQCEHLSDTAMFQSCRPKIHMWNGRHLKNSKIRDKIMYRSQSTWALLSYICLLSYVQVFQMFAIPCVFGQQLWNFDMLCLIMVSL